MSHDSHDDEEKTVQIKWSTVADLMQQITPQKACLIIISGIDMGSVIPLDQPKITLGRGTECNFVLLDDGVSRVHAEVIRHGPESVIIRDMGSTNGTFVGGQRIKEAILKKGDKVLLGPRTILKYEIQDQLEQTYQKQVYESSTRDGLTGVYNRRYFKQKIISDLSFARRYKIWFTLMIFDLDHFRKINDSFGHRIGDQVLINVAGSVLSMLKAEDHLVRYGGEEFAIIAPGTNEEGGLALAQRTLKRVESGAIIPSDGSNKIIKVTVSIGTTTVTPGSIVEPAAVISAAEGNLREAKRSGRNRVVGSVIK